MSTIPDSDAELLANDMLRAADAGGRVARGGLIRGVGYAAGVGLGLATSVLLLRHLGVADYGRYGTVAALMGLVLGITDGGMTAIGARELSVTATQVERERLASSLMALRASAAGIGVLAAIAFAAIAYEPVLVIGAVLLGLSVVLQSSQAMATVPLLADLRATPISVFDVLRQGLTLIGVLLLVVGGAGLVPFFGLQIPVVMVTLLTTVVVVRRSFKLGVSFHRAHVSHLVRETIPMSVAVVLNSLYLGAMVVLMSLLTDDSATGIYAAPARILEVLVVLASVMITMAIPVLAVSGTEDLERFRGGLQLLLQGGIAVACALALGIIAVAPELVTLIGGAAFAPSGTVLRIQAVALIGVFANQSLQFALVTLKHQRRLVIANAVALAVLLIAGFALVPVYGPNGGAMAVIIGEAALTAMLAISLMRADRRAAPSPRILLPLGFAAAIGGAALALPVNAWLVGVVAPLLFLAVAIATNGIPRTALRSALMTTRGRS